MKAASRSWSFWILTALAVCSAAGRSDNGQREMLQNRIETLKAEIDQEQASGRPGLGPMWAQLGMLYQGHDVQFHDGGSKQPLALEAFRNAIDSTDDEAVLYQVYQRMGMLLKMMGHGEEAVEAHKLALKLAGNSEEKSDALVQQANALGMMGDLEKAKKLLERALRVYPKGLATYLPLVSIHKELKNLEDSEWSALVDAMKTALEKFSQKTNGDIYWALFQALESLGRSEEAWEYLEIAHAATMANRERVSSIEQMDEQLQQVVTVFRQNMFPDPPLGLNSRTPVFIIGMMRSGSTLLETMLDAHPQIYGMGEDSFFNSGLSKFRDELVEVLSLNDNAATERVLKSYGKSVVTQMVNRSMNDESNVDKMAGKVKPKRVVDKMLFNYRNIGFIHLIFPKAVILHTVRDPMDTILSCFKHKFDDSGLDWALDMKRLSRQYINYLKNMHHFKKILPGRIYDVSYEALVTSTESTIKGVIKKVDIRWDDDVLNFHTKNRTVHTHSMGQVRHKVTSSGIGGWRKYADQLRPMIDLLQPELRKLKKMGALPFAKQINWELDPDFAYGTPRPVSESAVPGTNPGRSMPSKRAVVDGYAPHGTRRRKKMRKVKVTTSGDVEFDVETGPSPLENVDSSVSKVHPVPDENSRSGENSHGPRKRRKRPPVKFDVDGDRVFEDEITLKRKKRRRLKEGEPKINDLHVPDPGEQRERRSEPKRRKKKQRRNVEESPTKLSSAVADGIEGESNSALQDVAKKWKEVYRKPISESLRLHLPIPSERKIVTDLLVVSYSFFLEKSYDSAAQVLLDAVKVDLSLRSEGGVNFALSQFLLALQRFGESISYATALTQTNPAFVDGHLALASALGSVGKYDDAIHALTTGLSVTENDGNLLIQRGFNYFKLKKYKSAHADFSAANVDSTNEAYILSLIGKCEKEFGDSQAAINTLTKSLQLDVNQADAHLDMAIVLMEMGRVGEALSYVNSSLEIDPSMRNTWGYAGLLYQTLGECRKAIYYLGKTLEIDPYDHTSLLLSAMCHQAELDFPSSFYFFDRLMKLTGGQSYESNVPFHREIAFYRMNYLDVPLLDFNFDKIVDKDMKVGLNKRDSYPFPFHYNETVGVNARLLASEEVVRPLKPTPKAQDALDITAQLRGWIQLDSPGFLPHRRQHRMFGLAVLEMAQQLRAHIRDRQSGGPGLWINDARSSVHHVAKGGMVRPTDVRKKGHHLFSYRDFFDTAVKWRQLADPFDIVFWLDGYPPKTQLEMVALSTSLYSGLKRNTRYYPYFNFTFEVFRREMKEKYFSGPEPTYTHREQIPKINDAESLTDFFEISGVSSIMFVVTECKSLVRPGRKLPGTRVVLSKVPPEGYDISIGSPTEENRFDLFSAEVETAFNKIVMALIKKEDTDVIVDLTLDLYFYWANWGPLSRGTAATGYAAIISILLSVGEHVTSRIPHLKQMDWEAILRTDPSEFRSAVRSWLSGRERTTIPLEWLDGAPGYKLAGEVFSTPRDVVSALSAAESN